MNTGRIAARPSTAGEQWQRIFWLTDTDTPREEGEATLAPAEAAPLH